MSLHPLLPNLALLRTPSDVRQLNAALLQLAIQGRLLPDQPTAAGASYPPHWQVVRLDAIARVGTGGTPQRGNPRYYAGGKIPWITSSATAAPFITQPAEFITQAALAETNCQLYPPHTLIVALYGEGRTRGQVSELLIETTTNQACAAIVLEGEFVALRPWIKLYLQANYHQLRSLAGGAAQPNLNLTKIKALQIPLPPIREQQRILARFNELQSLTTTLETKLEQGAKQRESTYHALLEQLLHADAGAQRRAWQLLQEAFDDLVVDADAIGDLRRTILTLACCGYFATQEHTHAPAASPHAPEGSTENLLRSFPRASARFPAPPRHWAVVDFGAVASIQSGYIFKSTHYAADGVRLLRNINVTPGHIDWTDTVRIPWESAEAFSRFRLNAGDIVISLDRPLISTGIKVARLSTDDIPSLLVQRVGRIQFHTPQRVLSEYMLIWLNSPLFIDNLQPGRSAAVPHISARDIEDMPFPLPPLAEQHRIVEIVARLTAPINELRLKLDQAESLRRAWLSALLTNN